MRSSTSHEQLPNTPEAQGIARYRRDTVKRAAYKLQRASYEHAWEVASEQVRAAQTDAPVDPDIARQVIESMAKDAPAPVNDGSLNIDTQREAVKQAIASPEEPREPVA